MRAAACIGLAASLTAASTLSMPSPHVSTPRCAAGAISIEPILQMGAGNHNIASFRFTNNGKEPCVLTGRPRVTATLRGVPVATARTGTTFVYDPYPPRELARGDAAVLAVETAPNLCREGEGALLPRLPADTVVSGLTEATSPSDSQSMSAVDSE